MYPRVEWKGRTTFSRRNKACIFLLLCILKPGLSPEIPTQIDWHLKIQKTPILCIEVSSKPSPLHPWVDIRIYVKCIFIYIYVYVFIYMHTYIGRHTQMILVLCMKTKSRIGACCWVGYMYVQTCIYVYMYIYISYIHTYVYVFIYMYICIYV